jgi:hypothetical protein
MLLLLALLPVLASGPATLYEREQQAEAAEQGGRPEEALRLYEGILAEDASSPTARMAMARAEWLRAHSRAGFEPLTTFLRMKQLAASELTPARLTELGSAIDHMPPGLVRTEARAWLADSWLRVAGDKDRAILEYQRLLAEPDIEGGARQLATTRLAVLTSDQKSGDEGLAVLQRGGYGTSPAYQQLRGQNLQRLAHPLAIASFVLLALLTLAVSARSFSLALLRRGLAPGRLLMAAFVVTVPCAVAVQYQSTLITMYEWLGVLLAVMLGLTFIASEGLRRGKAPVWQKLVLAASASLASVGAGFLAIEHSEMLASLFQRL